MKLELQLTAEDFLTHQLFLASKSELIRKKRQKNKMIVPILYGFILLYSLVNTEFLLASVFAIFILLWFIFYPKYESNYYRKHYKKFIDENYQNKINKPANMEFYNDYIFTKDSDSEGKIQTTAITEIQEIADAIYIRLNKAQTFILPKNQILELEKITEFLQNLAKNLNIKYTKEIDWVWK